MMMNFRTPGVYIKEVEVTQPEIFRLGVAGFVGQAERGPLNYPQLLTSWEQFCNIFGVFVGFSYLPYSVFGFFLNGGERCYVVRVAHEAARKAALSLFDNRNSPVIPVIDIKAINEGKWANNIEVIVEEESTDDLILTETQTEFAPGTDTVKFKSVAGLAGKDITGSEKADNVTLIHRYDHFIREKFLIESINFATKEVTFSRSVTNEFPAESKVLGKGFKLIFRYKKGEKLILEEAFDNLSRDETHERYFVRVINGELEKKDEEKDYIKRIKNGNSILVRVIDLCGNTPAACSRLEAVEAKLENGDDGAHNLKVNYYTGYGNGKLFGLTTFETVSEIGTITIPDLIIPDFYDVIPDDQIPKGGIIFAKTPINVLKFNNLKAGQRHMLNHCEKMGDRFAILDSPRGIEVEKSEIKIEDWPGNFQFSPNAKYGALYYPWVKGKDPEFEGKELFIPPCGHIAGIYARTEQERGIGKAPANEILQGIIDFEFHLSDTEQDILNPRGVNCLRSFPGRGLLVWGARTLSSDSLGRYVNVRRVSLAIIKYITTNLQWTVFEPNDRRLWDRIVAVLTLFFRDLFQNGTLAGTKPEEAFFVKCDDETNLPHVIDRGQVITEIGFAPARPAEFVLVTITRTAESLIVSEQKL